MRFLPDLWVLTVALDSRRQEAIDLFDSLGTPPDRRVVVTNPPGEIQSFDGHLLRWPEPGINISNWWNLGLDFIAEQCPDLDEWDVLVAETDARMRPEDVDTVRARMREYDAVMAGGDWEHTIVPGAGDWFRTDNWAAPVGRIPGIMKVVAGETGIRHDPEYRWWLADDDYEWQHRVNGGTVLVEGIPVRHVGTTGPLQGERLRAWEEDQVKFMEKWGGMPATNGIPR